MENIARCTVHVCRCDGSPLWHIGPGSRRGPSWSLLLLDHHVV